MVDSDFFAEPEAPQTIDPKRAYWLAFWKVYEMLLGPTKKGTPPKHKTVHRILKQHRLGIDVNGKRVLLGDTLYHPTKGERHPIREPKPRMNIISMWQGV